MSWFGSWFADWFGPWFGDGASVPTSVAIPIHVRVVDDHQGVSVASGQRVLVVNNATNLIIEGNDG